MILVEALKTGKRLKVATWEAWWTKVELDSYSFSLHEAISDCWVVEQDQKTKGSKMLAYINVGVIDRKRGQVFYFSEYEPKNPENFIRAPWLDSPESP